LHEIVEHKHTINTTDAKESKRTKKRIINYHWHDHKPYSKGLFVPKPKERKALIIQMHKYLEHLGEQRTLVEICKGYFWHSRMEDVKTIVKNMSTIPNDEKSG
jgi:hypothetical protein